MNIKELKSLQEQMGVVEGCAFMGKVEKIYERHTGTSEYGDYSLQNVLVNDGTGKLMVNFRNRPEITEESIGKTVSVASKFNERQNKNIGARILKEDYVDFQGKEQSIVKAIVTESANVSFVEAGQEIPKETATGKKAGSQEHREDVAIQPLPEEVLEEAFHKAEMVLLHPEVTEMLHRVVEAGWTSEDFRTTAISMAIEMNRRQGR